MFNLKLPSNSNKMILYVCVLAVIVIIGAIFISHSIGAKFISLREAPITEATDSYIDVIGTVTVTNKNIPLQVMIRGKKDLFISGWAVDERSKLPAGSVEVNIDGKLFPTTYGLDRPDVANAYKVPAYRLSGFQTTIPVANIGKGEHLMSLKIFMNNKKAYYPAGDIIKFEIK